jgi:membrane protein DedA with SNARE-associated domain/membrane-associated phospholipid phosphatase
MATAETAAFLGFVAPGEFTIILGGVLAGEGTLSIGLLIGIVWASIVVGDSIGFFLGRRLGRSFVLKHGPRVRLTEERVRRVEDYFARHGGKTIFLGRWIGFVRPLMPFTAGTSGMAYRSFLPYDVLSAGLFGSCFSLLGYIFWRSFSQVASIAGKGAIGFGIFVAIVIGVVMAVKRLRNPEDRRRIAARLDRLGSRPALRPLSVVLRALWRFAIRPVWRVVSMVAARLAPPFRFLWHRLTPGGLGIELTSLLATAAVCGYVFGLYADLVESGHSTGTPGDDAAHDVAQDIRTSFLTSVMKAVSFLGTRGFTIAVIVVAVGLLIANGRRIQAAVLAAGYALIQVGVTVTKDLVERPRPSDPLVDITGWSFPSGHAANAIAYVVLAVILAAAIRKARWRVAVIVIGAVIAAVIGLSRVYLGVHYLSDVTSGWALGLAVYSLCGCIALVVSYLRNNERAGDERIVRGEAATSE